MAIFYRRRLGYSYATECEILLCGARKERGGVGPELVPDQRVYISAMGDVTTNESVVSKGASMAARSTLSVPNP